MKIIGLTGSISMGKTTVGRMLVDLGCALWDADAAVHRVQAPGGAALPAIAAAFPGTVEDNQLDRDALRRAVLGEPAALRRLEKIIHPMVASDRDRFLRLCHRRRIRTAVLDVPLLLEGRHYPRLCAEIWVVSAPAFLQAQRVLSRPGMTADRLAAIRARQMPDVEKRRRADRVIHTGGAKAATRRQVARHLRALDR